MRALAALLLIGCGQTTDPEPCDWHEQTQVDAGTDCVRLQTYPGEGLVFRASTDESCGGTVCLDLQPGESAAVLRTEGGSGRWIKAAFDCTLPSSCGN